MARSDKKIIAAQWVEAKVAFRTFCNESGISSADLGALQAFRKSGRFKWNFTIDEMRTKLLDNSKD
jgi:hypothetical protein